jgi:hypothetical protein
MHFCAMVYKQRKVYRKKRWLYRHYDLFFLIVVSILFFLFTFLIKS